MAFFVSPQPSERINSNKRGQNVRRTDICNGNGRRGRRHYRNHLRDDVSRSDTRCNALLSSWGGSLRLEQRGPQALEANTVCAYLIYRWGLLRWNSIRNNRSAYQCGIKSSLSASCRESFSSHWRAGGLNGFCHRPASRSQALEDGRLTRIEGGRMTWQTLILNINAVACILISIRLMFFRKRSLRRRRLMEFLAYGLILAPAFTAFRIWHGDYVQVDYGELVVNLVVCIAVWRARGNIARIAGESTT
ncbi:holin [Enterobacter cloacae]|uniref:Holin n=3 Tax=Enterobacteriaceae TaxID=543 RepID=A0A144J1L6_ENTCL|nr:holin [Enterobacter cloacae]